MEDSAAVQLMRNPDERRSVRATALAAIALLTLFALLTASTAEASRCIGVFFRGFNAPVGTSGMDNLEAHLATASAGNPQRPISTAVFNWTGQSEASDFIDSFTDIECLVLAGHSFGVNVAVEFTLNYLEPAGIPVDVLVQFDSVGANDGILPASVGLGLNYHQVSTGFFEPQGEFTVVGATNVYVESDYGVSDSAITHTEIDCPLFERNSTQYASVFGSQPDFFERAEGHVAPLFNVVSVPSMGWPAIIPLVAAMLWIAARSVIRQANRAPLRI